MKILLFRVFNERSPEMTLDLNWNKVALILEALLLYLISLFEQDLQNRLEKTNLLWAQLGHCVQ